MCLAFCAGTAAACDIPVYQYALEHWESSPYVLAVYHEGLTDSRNAQIEAFREKLEAESANLEIHPVDVRESMDEMVRRLWERDKSDSLPHACLYYPGATRISSKVWSGPLTEENLANLADSPKRKDVTNAILNGDTAVWIFLESGDSEKDGPALELLRQALDKYVSIFAGDSELDESSWWVEGLNPAFVKDISFEVVQVSREDTGEEVLIGQLLESEPGLKDLDEPMIFPAFGRGRLLYALVGKGITRKNLEQSLQFVLGPCSCIVKDDNPGVDLLTSVDWELELEDMLSPNVQPVQLSSVSGIMEAAAVDSATPPAFAPSQERGSTGELSAAGSTPAVRFRLTWMILALIILLTILVAVISIFLLSRMNR